MTMFCHIIKLMNTLIQKRRSIRTHLIKVKKKQRRRISSSLFNGGREYARTIFVCSEQTIRIEQDLLQMFPQEVYVTRSGMSFYFPKIETLAWTLPQSNIRKGIYVLIHAERTKYVLIFIHTNILMYIQMYSRIYIFCTCVCLYSIQKQNTNINIHVLSLNDYSSMYNLHTSL